MNNSLQTFARNSIRDGLAKLPESNHRIFKLMYGRANGTRSVEDALAIPINDIVDIIPDNMLDWAMQQVENSIRKSGKGE